MNTKPGVVVEATCMCETRVATVVNTAQVQRMAANLSKAVDYAISVAGLKQLKPEEEKVITAFVSGKDTVFASLPTGFGKSYCYSLLPLVFNYICAEGVVADLEQRSLVICVSPLTSLMMEQKAKFRQIGIHTEYVGELQQDLDAMKDVRDGQIQLLFISPELLLRNPQWREKLTSRVYKEKLIAVVVDEAHCVVSVVSW